MALRFRKSFKLAPGLRVNLSKRGASLSVGGRGFTSNVSSRGVRTTYSIPGTGISWTESHRSSAQGKRRAAAAAARAEKEALYQQALSEVEDAEAEFQDIVEAWRRMPNIPAPSDFEAALAPQSYFRAAEPPPIDWQSKQQQLRRAIHQENKLHYSKNPLYIALAVLIVGLLLTSITGEGAYGGLALLGFLLFTPVWIVVHFVRIARRSRSEYQTRWAALETNARADFEHLLREYHAAEEEKRSNWDALEAQRIRGLEKLLAGDRETVDEAVQSVLEELDFPFEALCAASTMTGSTVVVAVDLPEIEDVIPETRLKALKQGTVKEVRRTQRERKEAWGQLVLGIALQIARTICAVAPTVQIVRLAGYTQRRQRSGAIADEWVYEFAFERQFLAQLDPSTFDPTTLLKAPQSRILVAPDSSLKKIPPPEWLGVVAES